VRLLVGSKVILIDGVMLSGKPAKEGFIVNVKPLIISVNGSIVELKKKLILKVV